MLAPIILFVYNRPLHTKDLIDSLLLNSLAAESDLIIFSDSWKSEAEKAKVIEVRQYLKNISGFKSVTIKESSQNKGLAQSVITGVTEVVNRCKRVIVLEDDLVVAPHFLQFMNDALEIYKDESKVGHIQACDFTNDPILPDTFLIKWTGSWGWATWDRAWKLFNPNGEKLLSELKQRCLTRQFDFNGNYRFTRMLRKQIAGKNNSWAIRWNASLFLADVLSLNVGHSLVRNNGFDGSGTNCGGGNLYDSSMFLEALPVVPITPITENKEARRAFERYYHRTNCFWAKARRRIIRTFKGDFGA